MQTTRGLLLRQLQQFFETKLLGLYRWQTAGEDGSLPPPGTIRLRPAEKHEKVPGRRQLDKGIAAVDFDGYAIVVSSPDEEPPLGRILLYHPEHGSVDGPLDERTWERAAELIRRSRARDLSNVEHRHGPVSWS